MKWLIPVFLCLASCGVGKYSTSNVVICNQATGFLIDSFICTAAHVVQGEQCVEVKYQDGRIERAQVVAFDKANDVALLKSPEPVFVPYSIADPHIKETVTSVANPANLWFTEMEGQVQGVERYDLHGGPLIQVSLDCFYGASGAPVLNLNGELLGFISRFLPGTRFTFIVPINRVIILINKTKRG